MQSNNAVLWDQLTVKAVKVQRGDDLRRFPVTPFSELKAMIAASFAVDVASVMLKYEDEDGDLITIHSDPELLAALSWCDKPVFKCQLAAPIQPPLAPVAPPPVLAAAAAAAAAAASSPMNSVPACAARSVDDALPPWHNWHERRSKWAPQLQYFKSKGLPHGPFAVKLLEENMGNVAHCESVLQDRAQNVHERGRELQQRYAPQLQQLKSMGYECEPVCIRLLNKFSGDVNAVVQRLQQKAERRGGHCGRGRFLCHAFKNVDNSPPSVPGPFVATPQPVPVPLMPSVPVTEAVPPTATPTTTPTAPATPTHAAVEPVPVLSKWQQELEMLANMGFQCREIVEHMLEHFEGDVSAVALELSGNQQ